jgi:hypothetical protein
MVGERGRASRRMRQRQRLPGRIGALRGPGPGRTLPPVIIMVFALVVGGCSAVNAPDVASGRPVAEDVAVELFLFHGLAETLSTVSINPGDGTFLALSENVRELGSVPNDIRPGAKPDEILVTLSGENRLLVLDESTLVTRSEVVLPTGTNPMAAAALGNGLLASTGLFTGTVRVDDPTGTAWEVSGVPGDTAATADLLPVALPTGPAPQAILALTDRWERWSAETGAAAGDPREVFLLVANTAFGSANPTDAPYGEGSITRYRLTRTPPGGSGTPTLEVATLDAAYTFGATDSAGLNPTVLLPLPAVGAQPAELLVVGSGVNLTSSGEGADDGRLLVLDPATLAVRWDLAVGGSPGSAAIHRTPSGYRVYLAGPSGIRSAYRDDATGWAPVPGEGQIAYSTDGGTSLIADLAIFVDDAGVASLYATDYWRSQLIRFRIEPDGSLVERQTLSVPQGPQGLHLSDERGGAP